MAGPTAAVATVEARPVAVAMQPEAALALVLLVLAAQAGLIDLGAVAPAALVELPHVAAVVCMSGSLATFLSLAKPQLLAVYCCHCGVPWASEGSCKKATW